MSLRAVWTIARLTLREASRRRLLIAVAVLTLVLVGISAWGFQRITALSCGERGEPCSPLEQKFLAAILLTLITFMYSFIFALGAVFVSSPAIAAEVESGVLLAVLPRPLHRNELVLGKWLGVAIIVGGYAAVTAAAEFVAVGMLVGYTPPHPLAAIAFLVGQSLVMLTLSLLFSTRLAPMTGGIIALALFGLAWMGGIAQTIGTALNSDTVRNVGVATKLVLPADGLWRGALFSIQPSFVDALERASYTDGDPSRNPFFVIAPPSAAYIAWVVAWIVLVLNLAMLSFRRRDL
jgi:ABC-type transport system involved in multi-copper enzyme maturation permease subunit